MFAKKHLRLVPSAMAAHNTLRGEVLEIPFLDRRYTRSL